VRASRFVDTDVDIGTTYYYWINAYDSVENVSTFAPYVQATPVVITAGPIDSTAPDTPNAPTFVSESTYLSSDGGTFAKITITAPALPTGARVNQVLYNVSGSSDFLIACELTAAGSATIDDLTPGVLYTYAIRAVSFSNVRSAVSTTLSRAAKDNATAPTASTVSYISGAEGAPISQGMVPMYAIGVLVTAASTLDISKVEIKIVTTNDSASTAAAWFAQGNQSLFSSAIAPSGSLAVFFYQSNPLQVGFGFSRVISRSGVATSWTAVGSVQASSSYIKTPIGTIAQYNSNDVTTTGIKTGGGSSTRQVNVVYEINDVFAITGGATTYDLSISLTNRGFSAKPDDGLVAVEDVLYQGFYDSQSASSTSATAVIKIYRNDGGTLASGNLRLSARFTDYT
jgi:hypothetical protein